MFEQSILPDYRGAQKTGAMAASLTAQIALSGVLVVVPLLYNEVLPAFRLPTPLTAPLTPFETVAESKPAARGTVAQTSLSVPHKPFNPFRAPAAIPASPLMIAIDDASPSFSSPIGVPALISQPGPVIELAIPKPPDPPPIPAIAKPPQAPVPVTSEIQAAKILRKVVPSYPALARQARVQGTVHLIGVIAKDGSVQQLKVLSGHPLLVSAALSAVEQWHYRPTILNSEPVEVIAPIDVIFTLQ